jgi:hypothetical protein
MYVEGLVSQTLLTAHFALNVPIRWYYIISLGTYVQAFLFHLQFYFFCGIIYSY